MKVEFTRSFDKQFAGLSPEHKGEAEEKIGIFLEYYASRQFPKSLRMHKCGRFVSLSVSMNYRLFLIPIPGGLKFVFVGSHRDAENYLKK
jgi:hypothetical protein